MKNNLATRQAGKQPEQQFQKSSELFRLRRSIRGLHATSPAGKRGIAPKKIPPHAMVGSKSLE
jgi:hypothetical protein